MTGGPEGAEKRGKTRAGARYIIERDDWDPRRYEESMSLGPLTCELLQLLQRL
ncbi:MAG: hypothetical protein LM580_07505 [Thermofilum sp.]|nr:hypothetical protein [Thermofilum sp.]